MGKFSDFITPAHHEFANKQHMFFVSTAPLRSDGHVNLSPKGFDCFRFLSSTEVGYMDLTGCGNETSAHILENGRITIMFCSFEGAPNILRLYGTAVTVLPETDLWNKYATVHYLSQHTSTYCGHNKFSSNFMRLGSPFVRV